MAVGSLILGILGIVLSCVPQILFTFFGWIGALLALVAIILAILCKKNPENNGGGVATGGLVTGIIGLVLGLILFFACGLPVARGLNAINNAVNEINTSIEDLGKGVEDILDYDLDNLESDLESLFE